MCLRQFHLLLPNLLDLLGALKHISLTRNLDFSLGTAGVKSATYNFAWQVQEAPGLTLTFGASVSSNRPATFEHLDVIFRA